MLNYYIFLVDLCQLPKVQGPCGGNYEQWYYDKNSNRCLEFRFGGCQGNANRFNDQLSCESHCVQNVITTAVTPFTIAPTQPSDVCHIPLDPGPCLQTVRLVMYNNSEHHNLKLLLIF